MYDTRLFNPLVIGEILCAKTVALDIQKSKYP